MDNNAFQKQVLTELKTLQKGQNDIKEDLTDLREELIQGFNYNDTLHKQSFEKLSELEQQIANTESKAFKYRKPA